MEPDDPQISYLLSSWARIGAILGEDFIPFLPIVMPPLLRSATIKPDLALLGRTCLFVFSPINLHVWGWNYFDSLADDDTDKFDPAEGWEFVNIEGQTVAIKTSNLDEKCTAVEMLYCYVKELKGGFHQYAAPVMEIVIPLLKFYFDDSNLFNRLLFSIGFPDLFLFSFFFFFFF